MKSKFKTVYRQFHYLRCDDFAHYLESMAARGWHLDSWGAGLKFRRGEPEQTTYAVEVFTDASEYDTRPELHTREFAEYCEAAGWQLVDAKQKFVIFKKIKPDAIPIMTDRERLEAAVKEEQKFNRRTLFTASIWVILEWWRTLGGGFADMVFSPLNLLLLFGFTTLFLGALISVIQVNWKKHSWLRRIEEGQMLYLGRAGGFASRGYDIALIPVMTLWLGFMVFAGDWGAVLTTVIFFAVLLGTLFLVNKFRVDSVTNEVVMNVLPLGLFLALFLVILSGMFVIDQTEVPESLTDGYQDLSFREPAMPFVHYEEKSTFLGSATIVVQREEGVGSVYYGVYESDYDWVLDKVWKNRTADESWEPCTQDWGGDQVMIQYGRCYVVRYPNHVLYYYAADSEPLTQAQIELIVSTLIP